MREFSLRQRLPTRRLISGPVRHEGDTAGDGRESGKESEENENSPDFSRNRSGCSAGRMRPAGRADGPATARFRQVRRRLLRGGMDLRSRCCARICRMRSAGRMRACLRHGRQPDRMRARSTSGSWQKRRNVKHVDPASDSGSASVGRHRRPGAARGDCRRSCGRSRARVERRRRSRLGPE